MARLRRLDRKHTLVFLIWHRSYLDGWTMGPQLPALGFSPTFFLGGSNANVFPSTSCPGRRRRVDPPFHRGAARVSLALRAYIEQILRNRKNLWWSIEGGRTRTGKLRPPRFGLLKYVVDAVAASMAPRCCSTASNVYDQLHEAALRDLRGPGAAKPPADGVWFAGYALNLRKRMGRVYVDFGEPLRLRERLAELEAQRADLDRPTGGARRLSPPQPGDPRHPHRGGVRGHARRRPSPVARRGAGHGGAAGRLPEPPGLAHRRGGHAHRRHDGRRALQDLVSSGVLTSYSGGDETVWAIGPDQHLDGGLPPSTVRSTPWSSGPSPS